MRTMSRQQIEDKLVEVAVLASDGELSEGVDIFRGEAPSGAVDKLERFAVVFLAGVQYRTTLDQVKGSAVTYGVAVHALDRKVMLALLDGVLGEASVLKSATVEASGEARDSATWFALVTIRVG